MFEHTQAVQDNETPDSTVGRIGKPRFLSESGVYAKLALAIESFGKTGWEDEYDDEPDAVTLVRVPALVEPEPLVQSVSPRDELQMPAPHADHLQVVLHLRGEELARLWARNGAALAGRAHVWSQQSQSWNTMDEGWAPLRSSGHPSLAVPNAAAPAWSPVVQRTEASARTRITLADYGFVALGAAAALSVILCLTRLIGYANATAVETKHSQPIAAEPARDGNAESARDARQSRRSVNVLDRVKTTSSEKRFESSDIIPVTALPLIGKRSAGRSRSAG